MRVIEGWRTRQAREEERQRLNDRVSRASRQGVTRDAKGRFIRLGDASTVEGRRAYQRVYYRRTRDDRLEWQSDYDREHKAQRRRYMRRYMRARRLAQAEADSSRASNATPVRQGVSHLQNPATEVGAMKRQAET